MHACQRARRRQLHACRRPELTRTERVVLQRSFVHYDQHQKNGDLQIANGDLYMCLHTRQHYYPVTAITPATSPFMKKNRKSILPHCKTDTPCLSHARHSVFLFPHPRVHLRMPFCLFSPYQRASMYGYSADTRGSLVRSVTLANAYTAGDLFLFLNVKCNLLRQLAVYYLVTVVSRTNPRTSGSASRISGGQTV